MTKSFLIAASVLAFAGLGACSQEGSAEKTGENLDSAIEEATQGEKNLSDGALERAGESVDKATHDGASTDGDAADALHDATDGNPETKP